MILDIKLLKLIAMKLRNIKTCLKVVQKSISQKVHIVRNPLVTKIVTIAPIPLKTMNKVNQLKPYYTLINIMKMILQILKKQSCS